MTVQARETFILEGENRLCNLSHLFCMDKLTNFQTFKSLVTM